MRRRAPLRERTITYGGVLAAALLVLACDGTAGPPPNRCDATMMGVMRIDWLPFLVVFLTLTIIVGGTLIGLYALFNRLISFLEKRDK